MLKTIEQYKNILELWETGLYNKTEIGAKTNTHRLTVGSCIKRYKNSETLLKKISSNGKIMLPKQQSNLLTAINLQELNSSYKHLWPHYSYLLGVVLGDGSLVAHTKVPSVFCLKVSCDIKYPNIYKNIIKTIKSIMPLNSVKSIAGKNNDGYTSWIDVYCYSQDWKYFFPFFKEGTKHSYTIELESWQRTIIETYPKEFVKGLIQTDGHRYVVNNKYKPVRYGFTQKSLDIMNIFLWGCKLLHLSPTLFLKKYKSDPHFSKDNIIVDREIWIASLCTQKDTIFLDTFIGPKT
jgi:hypothetical protein